VALVAEVWRALESVTDPEYPLSIVDLGMVYGAGVQDGSVSIDLTFTSIGCPAMEMIVSDIREAVGALPGVTNVDVRVVWSPPWSKDRISARGRRVLAMYGVVN
jgi:phenylacetate-CoA oxygenase PaaJ subunit